MFGVSDSLHRSLDLDDIIQFFVSAVLKVVPYHPPISFLVPTKFLENERSQVQLLPRRTSDWTLEVKLALHIFKDCFAATASMQGSSLELKVNYSIHFVAGSTSYDSHFALARMSQLQRYFHGQKTSGTLFHTILNTRYLFPSSHMWPPAVDC